MDLLGPIIGTLGVGGLAGFAAGFALKKAMKFALFVFGALFILLQVLAYHFPAMVHIDWGGLAREGAHGAQSAGSYLWRVLTFNVPLGAGFAAGLAWGLRKG